MHRFKYLTYLYTIVDQKEVRDILLDQIDEIEKNTDHRIIKREIQAHGKKLIKSKLAKMIFGVRRSGKSTFSHQILTGHEYAYINFDDERLVGISKEDLGSVFQIARDIAGDPSLALLDEIQNIEGWELFINRSIREGMNLVITGSSSNLLSTELSTHLTGRYLPVPILPFSFREFLIARGYRIPDLDYVNTKERTKLISQSESYLREGGFPLAVLDPDNAGLYLKTLYDDIINKDVIGRFRPKYVRTLRELSLFLTSSSSNLMTYSSLKRRFGFNSTHTVMNYCQYLVDASLIKIVDKFTFRQKERSASPKKVYSVDNGFVELLSTSPGNKIADHLENAVYMELLKRHSFDPTVSINYWRDYQNHEVDIVVSKNRKVLKLIQVSAISDEIDLNKRESRSLVKGSYELGCDDLLLITKNLEGILDEKGKKIVMKPFWKWSLEYKL